MEYEVINRLNNLFNYEHQKICFCMSIISAVDRCNILNIMSEMDMRLILKYLDSNKKKEWLLEVIESDETTDKQIEISLSNLIRTLEYWYLDGSKYRTYGIILSTLNYNEINNEYFEPEDLTEKEKYLVRRYSLTFESLRYFDSVSIQRIIREVDDNIWIQALSNAPVSIIEKILSNISTRKRKYIEEELKYHADNTVVSSKEAQDKIIIVIKKLEEAGEIIVV